MKECINGFFKTFNNIVDIVLDFIYPENISCIICNKPISKINTYSICKSCFDELHFILDGCVKCGKPIINHTLELQDIQGCSYCLNKNFYFDKAISCIEYDETSKKLILGLKYNKKTYISKYIAEIMKEKIDLENIKADYISCVPLHRKRFRKRGYNQSQKIAKELSKLMKLEVVDLIERDHYTRRLYNLSKREREKELKNAFSLKSNVDVKNKYILLIDDIFTTGSTTNEISKILKLSGVSKIYVMTFLTRSMDTYCKV